VHHSSIRISFLGRGGGETKFHPQPNGYPVIDRYLANRIILNPIHGRSPPLSAPFSATTAYLHDAF
jgi:hypothetical protein